MMPFQKLLKNDKFLLSIANSTLFDFALSSVTTQIVENFMEIKKLISFQNWMQRSQEKIAKCWDYKDDLKNHFFSAFLKSEKFLLSNTMPKPFELENCADCRISKAL